MHKIPKTIVEKIEQRNRLNEEISEWCKNNLDMKGMDADLAKIKAYHTGEEQSSRECKEWCDQMNIDGIGDYYWETECKGKYLHMAFSIYEN